MVVRGFQDRRDAGRQLAAVLVEYEGRSASDAKDVVVLALPRGGVVLGAEVAKALRAPLGLVLVRKISHPHNPEFAIGALADDQDPVYDPKAVSHLKHVWLKKAVTKAYAENDSRRELYYGSTLSEPAIQGKTIIVVDDGIATGWTMKAALQYIRSRQPKAVVVAVPVCPTDSLQLIEGLADKIIVLEPPEDFRGAVGAHYQEFSQVSNGEVRQLLAETNKIIA